MHDRKIALTTFASGKSGHSFGLDSLIDDVIYAEASNGASMPRPGGLDAQTRNFLSLYFHYVQECRAARAKAGL